MYHTKFFHFHDTPHRKLKKLWPEVVVTLLEDARLHRVDHKYEGKVRDCIRYVYDSITSYFIYILACLLDALLVFVCPDT